MFYRIHDGAKVLESFDYFCNARDYAQDLRSKNCIVHIIRSDGRLMPFGVKRLCVFYKFADKWVGKKIEWIVCKECQKKLRAGEHLYTQFLKRS